MLATTSTMDVQSFMITTPRKSHETASEPPEPPLETRLTILVNARIAHSGWNTAARREC